VTWAFETGDCASNGVQTVRVTWGVAGGMTQDVEFACAEGKGKLGDFSVMGGAYSLTAIGLDGAGVARFRHFSSTVMVGAKGTGGSPVDLTLRPKPADVVVNWRVGASGGCPPNVVLPYFITLYRPPAMTGGALTQKVTDRQETCTARTTTLTNVAPGDYVVELDSRAVTPMLKDRRSVTVRNGENATVDFQF
jgi:hypothetical protein